MKKTISFYQYWKDSYRDHKYYMGECPECGNCTLDGYTSHPEDYMFSMSCESCSFSEWFSEDERSNEGSGHGKRDKKRENYEFLVFDKISDFMNYKVNTELLRLLKTKDNIEFSCYER